MNGDWRYKATSITKYNPIYRDEIGRYKREEWIGFFQINKVINGVKFTFETYLVTEEKYIQAAHCFFEFHKCVKIILKNVDRYDFSDYKYDDREELLSVYNEVGSGYVVTKDKLSLVIKLILRELLWAELFCGTSSVAVRFGWDYYMYFSSSLDLTPVFEKVQEIGLYVY